jgi:hypothetical protein
MHDRCLIEYHSRLPNSKTKINHTYEYRIVQKNHLAHTTGCCLGRPCIVTSSFCFLLLYRFFLHLEVACTHIFFAHHSITHLHRQIQTRTNTHTRNHFFLSPHAGLVNCGIPFENVSTAIISFTSVYHRSKSLVHLPCCLLLLPTTMMTTLTDYYYYYCCCRKTMMMMIPPLRPPPPLVQHY